MGEYLNQVPVEIQSHLRQITKTSGLPDTEDSLEMIAQAGSKRRNDSTAIFCGTPSRKSMFWKKRTAEAASQ